MPATPSFSLASFVNQAEGGTQPPNLPVQQWHAWEALCQVLGPLLMAPADHAVHLADALHPHAAQLVALTREDPDVALFHMVHGAERALDRYSVRHAVHTAMLVALIGRRKDWGDGRTALGVKAALTMNLSIMALQNTLARQTTPLTEAQRLAIEQHPVASRQLLSQLGVTDTDWLDAVSEHHEQSDGRGYPLGLQTVHPLADAIHTCDVFSAKLSPRASRGHLPGPQAAAEIFRQRSAGYFGATLIREVGLYPPGSLVDLASGERAVVLYRTSDAAAPVVAVVTDALTSPLPRPLCSGTARQGPHRVLGAAVDRHGADTFPPDVLLGLR